MHPYLLSLIGGALIGIASSAMLGGLGRIAGISGIFMGAFTRPDAQNSWRYAFLAGLLGGGVLFLALNPELMSYDLAGFSFGQAVIAGLLVGFGTRLGSGCTSGHGVCGLARLSKRSFAATLTFMFFGILTVAVRRFLL